MKTFTEMHEKVLEETKKGRPRRLALAGSDSRAGLHAVQRAAADGLVAPILVGDAAKTRRLCEELAFDISGCEVLNEPDGPAAAHRAVQLVREGRADVLMKGSLSSRDYLRPVVDRENGIRTGGLLSNIAVMEAPSMGKFLLLTDCGMILRPTLEEKVKIIENAVPAAKRLGIERPKAAVICATEEVNPQMPATQDAAQLTMMNRRGQIRDCVVDGPLAFDLAVSPDAVRAKGIESEVAGDADILLFPSIETGNAVCKSMRIFGGLRYGSFIAGAAAPVIMMSRSAGAGLKQDSILLALCLA